MKTINLYKNKNIRASEHTLISIVSERERERERLAFQILKGESLGGPKPAEISIHHAKPQHSRLHPIVEKKSQSNFGQKCPPATTSQDFCPK